jgi:hypothetical protein
MFFKKILALAMLAAVLLPLVVSADSAGTFPVVGRMFFDLNGDGEWGAHERSIVGKVTLSQGGVALKKNQNQRRRGV